MSANTAFATTTAVENIREHLVQLLTQARSSIVEKLVENGLVEEDSLKAVKKVISGAFNDVILTEELDEKIASFIPVSTVEKVDLESTPKKTNAWIDWCRENRARIAEESGLKGKELIKKLSEVYKSEKPEKTPKTKKSAKKSEDAEEETESTPKKTNAWIDWCKENRSKIAEESGLKGKELMKKLSEVYKSEKPEKTPKTKKSEDTEEETETTPKKTNAWIDWCKENRAKIAEESGLKGKELMKKLSEVYKANKQ